MIPQELAPSSSSANPPYPLTFPDHTPQTAPEGARASLERAQTQFRFIPSPLARMAAAPASISAFEQLNALWAKTSLTTIERETVVLTLAVHNRCHYCVAMHSALLSRAPNQGDLVDRLRRGQLPADARLAALVSFTKNALVNAGAVDAPTAYAFAAAGYSNEQALEVLIGIATYTLSTFANRLTRAPLDAAFAAFEWREHS